MGLGPGKNPLHFGAGWVKAVDGQYLAVTHVYALTELLVSVWTPNTATRLKEVSFSLAKNKGVYHPLKCLLN